MANRHGAVHPPVQNRSVPRAPDIDATRRQVRETGQSLSQRLQAGVTALHGSGPGLREHVGHVRDAAAQTLIEADARASYSRERSGAWRSDGARRAAHAAREPFRGNVVRAAQAAARNRRRLIVASSAATAALVSGAAAVALRALTGRRARR